uniref:Snf2-related CREBBP activator protein n=1 Tax=Anabas testudineus TaxID=64144 RepID=A0A7N6FHU6_ANATE
MENAPETLTISSASKDSISEEVPAKENIAEVVGVAAPLTEGCSASTEMQKLPSPLCPPLASDTQIDSTLQELQYGSQTDTETSHSNSETNQIQSPREGAALVVITGTKEKQFVTVEYRPETGTNVERGGKEHTGGNILPQPRSEICLTSCSVPQSSVGFKVTTEYGAEEQSDRDSIVHANQGSHNPLSGAAEQAGGHQDSQPSTLFLPLSGNSENKQTDLSKPQTPKTINEISNDAREIQKTNSLGSVEIYEHVKALVETQPLSVEILETQKARESLCSMPSDTADRADGNNQRSCDPPEGEAVDSMGEEQTDTTISSSDFTELPECSATQNSSNPSAAPALFDTGLVQIHSTETPLIAELVQSSDAQEIVVVGEEAHISGDWSNVHLNPSYLLQREDGSVCEAAIVNELSTELSTGEPKRFEESVQADIELHSQPVEVYEFCSLVEEVAEETVCAASSAQIAHSPAYEVNLFNALLENPGEYTVKEGLESHLQPSIHTISESDTLIISQQPLPASHDANQLQACSINSSHNLSIQNARVAAVGHHLVLDANPAVEVTNSSEVCLLEVAAVTSDSFTVEHTDTSAQILTSCSQVSAALSHQTEVITSPVIHTVPQKQETETTAGILSLVSPVGSLTVHVSHVENQPPFNQTPAVTILSATNSEACVSSLAGTTETPALTKTPSQSIQNVAVAKQTKPESFCTTNTSGNINSNLLLLKPGATHLLKHPPSLLAKVSQQQNAAGKLANAHSSWSGTKSEECLPQTVSAVDSLCASVALSSQKDQTQCSVNKNSVTAAPQVSVQQPTVSGNITLQLAHTASVTPTSSTSKSDKEALTVSKTSSEADPAPPVKATNVSPLSTPHTLDILSASVEREGTASTSPTDHQPDSLYAEEESEDMDQDEATLESEAQEATSGQVSSPEEGSDEEPDNDKTESEMTTPGSTHKHGQSRTDRQALFLKVRQWIADRVTVNSSPVSPSTSSSYPGPSPISDWATPRRERSSPLRGPHGKFVSPSSVGAYSSSSSPSDQTTSQRSRGERHTDMAELAKHEADIEHRTQALKREGFWSMKRLTRLTEPQRPKVHWDYLCEEMQWLSADFAQERRWKRGVARKVVRMVMRHHEEQRQKEEKAKRDEHAKIRRVASSIAKEVRAFWSSVEKVVQYKQQSRLEEKRKKALDLQLDFIVGQTEKYSDLLSKSLAPIRFGSGSFWCVSSLVPPSLTVLLYRDFEPPCEEEDDEETIEVEEQQEGNDAESHRKEIELLKEEGMLPLDQLLSTLNLPQTSSSAEEEEEDGEFTANEEDAEDEEETIAAQEKIEGSVNHVEELDDLAKEGDMSIEELLEKYKGAYASDFEVPSPSGSKASSDSEVSGDEEEESEEDESDVESNTSSSDSAEEDDSEKDDEESEEEDDEDDSRDEGMEILLKEGDHSPSSSGSRPKKEISHIAATAESLQPKGYTLATTKVKTPIPFLLHGTLREYQHIGLDWLVTMYEKKLNGILADEMGLGKTIQTIALLAHLACEKGNWGPHLIIVPTSVMLNWEMELKRWCPGFKILTYFGSQKERKLKRQGWTKPNAFHVCITSYKLVLQDHQAFRRKSWRYLILDEAQNIKNFKSQRWQSLLNFNSHRRLLLTGTPLQNSLMELWSLMHFLMPHVFQSHREFKEWFSNPLTGMIEGSQEYNEGLVKRLHKVLRPFLLRRIKADVEKQMPKKYEHVVRCRLSKRQRFLYDDFMAQASTRETLASGHFMSVINILMQLRKVCNHPNLFDPRPIQSPFITQPIVFYTASLVQDALEVPPLKRCDLSMFDLVGLESHVSRYQADVFLPRHKVSRQLIQEIVESPEPPPRPKPVRMKVNRYTVQLQILEQSSAPKPVLTVRPPTAPCTASIPAHPGPNTSSIMPQRVLLSPDMQARLPSGEVVSIAQLASLAGRPVSSCQGSKPVTFQLQGNKLTLSGAQIHQVPAASSRPVQVSSSMVSSPGVVKIVVRQSAGKEGGPVPTLAVAPSPRVAPQASPSPHANTTPVRNTAPLQIAQRTPGPATAHYTIAPPRNLTSTPNQPQPPRPVLKLVQPLLSSTEQPGERTSSHKQCIGGIHLAAVTYVIKIFYFSSSLSNIYLLTQQSWMADSLKQQRDSRLDFIIRVNELRGGAKPVYGQEVLNFLTFLPGPRPSPATLSSQGEWGRSEAIHSIEERLELLSDVIDRFTFAIPPVEAPPISMHCCHPPPSLSHKQGVFSSMLSTQVAPLTRSLHRIQCNMRTQFPDLRLIQYDCGKLQTLHTLLRKLKTGGHRVLIFTQMTRMLDVLEQFLNYHGHIYLRLDGSTRVEQRQALMERFNADRRIFCFILSTRSGGVGVNLTGADTVVFYDSDWNPTMDAQAQDRCHRIGQTRDVHIYRLISERTVEENILKKANQKRMLGDMAIEGGNFTTAFFKQQTIRELFDVNDGEKREVAVELSVPQAEEEEAVNKQSTTILEQALCRAEDEEDIVAASQAKAEQVAELAEFNENIPLDDGGEQEEVEELSKAEQEIAALVEQLTPIERYAMNFLEASLEDVCKEELKQAEEQVEAARKGLDQAKEEGLKLHASSDDDDDDFLSPLASVEPAQPTPARRGRKPKDKDKIVTSTRTSGRLRGASPETEPEPTTPREVPERLRLGLRGRGAAKDAGTVSTTPLHTDHQKTFSSTRPQDSIKSSKASSPARDHQTVKTKTVPNCSHSSPVPSPSTISPPAGKQQCAVEPEQSSRAEREEHDGESERRVSESSLESSCPVDHPTKDDESKDHSAMSPPSTSSRSPRKRQSADGEVLRGLVEDSPSAKVLRKLPGRLVTVVEEKEPRRRRQRVSGTAGGASLEEAAEENAAGLVDEPNKDNTSPSPDSKTKGAVTKSPQDQDFTPSHSVHPQPVRSYPPYSPPHLSPDMPMLRNLPVRRRLETESRMAAQLGEQQQHPGRGRGGNQSKKTDTPPGKDATSTSAESSVNSLVTPLKRKRGRPPKTPPRIPESDNTVTPSPQPTSPGEEGNPPLSPKRKRGRPRKDSTTMPDTVGEGHSSKKEITTTDVSGSSKPDASTEPAAPQKSETPIAAAVSTGQGSQAPRAQETDTKTDVSAPAPNSAQASTAASASVPVPATPAPQVTTPLPLAASTSPSAQVVCSPPAAVPSSDTASTHVSSASSSTSVPVTGTLTTTTPPPAASTTISPPLPDSKPPTLVASTALVETKTSTCTSVKATGPDCAVCVAAPVAATPTAPPTMPVRAVRTLAPATTITTATTTVSETVSVTPAVTTTANTLTTTNAAKDWPQALTPPATSSSSTVISTPVPSLPSPASATSKPTSASSTATTAIKTAQAKPSDSTITTTAAQKNAELSSSLSPTETQTTPSTPATSAPLTTVATAAVNTAPASSAQEKMIVTTTKPESTSVTEVVVCSAAAPATTCTASPATLSSSVTTTDEAKTVEVISSTPAEGIKVTMPPAAAAAAAPSGKHTTTSITAATTTEKTVESPPSVSVSVSRDATTAPLIIITTTTSTQEQSVTAAMTNTTSQVSDTTAITVSAGATTAATTTPEEQNSASIPEVFAPAEMEALPQIPTSAPSSVLSENQSTEPKEEESASKSDSEREGEIQADAMEAEERTSKEEDDKKRICKSQPKRKKVSSSSETKESETREEEAKTPPAPEKAEPKQQVAEETPEDQKPHKQKRPLSRQSSQESARSSSPSSGCSTSTLTRHAHHKRTYENRHPGKRRRMDVTSEAGEEDTKEEGGKKTEEGGEEERGTAPSRKRHSRSSSSSSDSDNDEDRKEHRLTRSAKRRLQDQEKEKDNKQARKKPAGSSDRNASNNANTSTGGESGSDTSSVRTTRKSAASQPSQESKSQTNSAPLLPPEPEVLGKRCSALNAAAKLLAMKGRVDTPGHTPRKDSAAKAAGISPASSSEKNQKPKTKSVAASPQSNSTNNKSSGSKPSTPNQPSRPPSRSTRQCPGSLLPPLEMEYKRSKPEEKETGRRKSSRGKEGEAEAQSSSRGHSACSSMSSDGEGDGGGRSSRSRSSSNSSQRTHSISSQNTERRGSRSRAASSGSERDRSSERAKSRDKKEKQGQQRESRKDSRRSQKLSQEVTSSSGTEGTPDRVLRSVAALAAVQARSPAASTRSSSSQHRNNKT